MIKQKIWGSLSLALLCNAFMISQTNKTPSLASDINIKHEKFVLANGLTLLVHEDQSDPIVYVDVTYHVGSAREQQGRSGFAHFFEHMMFQGSKNVADEQHFKIITEAGGTLNGSTNSDRTNYFETVPNNQLEKMLWLESDRMGFLLDSVTQAKFEVQRATVKNERGQRYDNAPYGITGEKIGEALYPQGHPYSWTTIGYIADLNRVDVNDLKRFYMRWYGPNNAVLTVSGNVRTEEVLRLAEKYFGSIKRGPEVTAQTVAPFKLEGNRYISYEDNVKFPAVYYVYPTVSVNHKDDAAMDVLSEILTNGKSAPFYKAFIETGKAVAANSFQYSRELAGQFQLTIRANPTSQLSEIDKEVKETLKKWEKEGVRDDDLVKFKAEFQSNLYNRLTTVQGKGAMLADNFTMHGDANYLKKEIERYMSVTKEDVMRVYNTYIKGQPAVVLSCLPKGKGDLRVQPDNWTLPERKIELESAEYKNLTFAEPKDVFDRSKAPAADPVKPTPMPRYSKGTLANRVPVVVSVDNEIPKINILITFRAGHRFEAREKSGLAELTAAMLEQSSLKTKGEEIENKLSRLGSSVDVYSGDEDFSISIQCLKQNLNATLKIVEESLLEPKFDAAEFEIEKKKQLDRISQQQTNAGITADIAFRKLLYGEAHTMSYPNIGTAETVGKLDLKDVKDYYGKLSNSLSNVIASGDLDKSTIQVPMAFLTKFKQAPASDPQEPEIPKIEKTKIYFIDKKNAAQSEIRFGNMGVPFIASPMFYKCVIMNFSFAGAFNSRVNYSLREIKGWTYGVRGAFNGTKFAGPYTISGGFKANTTDSAINEIYKELKNYSDNGIKDDEFTFTKTAILQSEALKYESPMQKLYFLKRVLEYNLPNDYLEQQSQILTGFTKTDLNNIARFRYPYNNMNIVVVGDKATNFENVKKLGFEVIEMDVNGKLIN